MRALRSVSASERTWSSRRAVSGSPQRRAAQPQPHHEKPGEAERDERRFHRLKQQPEGGGAPRFSELGSLLREPALQEREPVAPREEETVVVFVEDELVARAQQESKVFYLPVARIASQK